MEHVAQRIPSEPERLQANARTMRNMAATAEMIASAKALGGEPSDAERHCVAGAAYSIAAALYELAAAQARKVRR